MQGPDLALGDRRPHDPTLLRAASSPADAPSATGKLILETSLLGPLTIPDGAGRAAVKASFGGWMLSRGRGQSASSAARRRPDRKSSRCSGTRK